MAQLKSGSTVGGNSILTTASSVGFPSGTVMVFHQASAPTGWTKSTAHNDKALRVVSGSGGGSGGTHALSSPPSTSHTHTGPSHSHSTPNHTHGDNLSGASHTLTNNQVPSHSHSMTSISFGNNQVSGQTGIHGTSYGSLGVSYTTSSGGGGSHSHSISGSVSSGGASTTGTAAGNTGSAGSTAFAPQYVDVIVATKD